MTLIGPFQKTMAATLFWVMATAINVSKAQEQSGIPECCVKPIPCVPVILVLECDVESPPSAAPSASFDDSISEQKREAAEGLEKALEAQGQRDRDRAFREPGGVVVIE
jgi:hypothetical protein